MFDQMANAVSMLRLLNCSPEERASFLVSLRGSVHDGDITRERLNEYAQNIEALARAIQNDEYLNMGLKERHTM